MKPGDFFLGLRQLLGVLVPGAVWLLAISLLSAERSPIESLSSINAPQVLFAVVAAFILGYAARGPAFAVGIRIANLFPARAESRKLSCALQPTPESERLLKLVLDRVPREAAEIGDAPRPLYQLEDVPAWAKYSILGNTELARRLDEIEAEINLYATMVLPVLALFVAQLIFWYKEQMRPTWGGVISEICLLLIAISFASRTGTRRKSEVRDVYLMFLALTDARIKHKAD